MAKQGIPDRRDLFRYWVIAPLLYDDDMTVNKKLELLANRKYYFKGQTYQYSKETIKKWYYKYKKEGFDKLRTKIRIDKDKSRKLSDEAVEYITYLISKYPKITIKNIYEILKEEKYITEEIKIDTFYRFIRTNTVKREKAKKQERRRYEKKHPNDVWQADTSYGPYIKIGEKKYRTYLIHFIDDNSRLVVGHGFYLRDTAINVQKVFKEAIATYGKPKQIYLDNGKSYSNEQLELICARLEIKLTHTHPYDPESKGKVERCFKTIKEGWMYRKDWNLFESLEDLNKQYDEYLYEKYNNKVHSELKDTPNNVWHKGIEEVVQRRISEEELEEAFMHEIKRKVGKDRTIRVDNKLYEVPVEYKLQTITIKYKVKDKEEMWIYENNKRCEKVKRLDKKANSEIKRKITYRGIINDESDIEEYEEK